MDEKLSPVLKDRLATQPDGDLKVQIFLRQGKSSLASARQGKPADRRGAISFGENSTARLNHFSNEVAPQPGANGAGSAPFKSHHFRELRRNWINGSIAAEVSHTSLQDLLKRPEVVHVDLVDSTPLAELLGTDPPAPPLPPSVPAVAPHIELVGAKPLWDRGLRGAGTLVAVIDGGIDFSHPDLKACAWDGGPEYPFHGFNFVSPDDPPKDTAGHGTKCAGLVAGDGTENLLTGIAPEARLMALRVEGVQAHVWSAFEFAIKNDVDVISMSFGWGSDQANYLGWRRACDVLLRAGIVLVCAAGDLGEYTGTYALPYNVIAPAICPPPWLHPAQNPGGRSAAIACGEIDFANNPQPDSSFGPGAWEVAPFTDYPYEDGSGQGLIKPDLCAPGRGAMTCNMKYRSGGPYLPFGGTSASTAIVAGCASLLVGAAKRAGKPVVPLRIQEALERTAVPLKGQTTKQNVLGSGRVDVNAAFGYGVARGWWK